MESFVTPVALSTLTEYIRLAKTNPKVEVECKLLSGLVQTKDVADRIIRSAEALSIETKEQEPYLTLSYPDDVRIVVNGVQSVHKVCTTNSLRGIAVDVEKKQRYGGKDVLDAPELNARFTLRTETKLKKDSDENPNSAKHIRLIMRKSYVTRNNLFQIDISMVKSRDKYAKTVRDILKQPHKYEVEIEFIDRQTTLSPEEIVKELFNIITELSKAYYESPFLLSASDIQKYQKEFESSGVTFYNVVTLLRRHAKIGNPYNVTEGYTVTNKADGERSGLYVARDKKVLKITPSGRVTWTGMMANTQTHIGDFIDGEYLADKDLFCIFDVYRFRNRDTRELPLMTTDDDTIKNPLNSRLGCAKLFVEDLKTEFTIQPSLTPIQVQTKLFLAGDGSSMEEAIQTILKTDFGYKIDGLIFTPRKSRVAPAEDRRGNTWLRVYKWKPASQNSIDFLVRISDDVSFDPVLRKQVKKGELYVSRNATDDIIYPRETMNGEYVPRQLPTELKRLSVSNTRVPSLFQPAAPRDPDAYVVYIPVNEKGVPIDEEGNKIDSNTIVECAFDVDNYRWVVMRTRYDKTYQYRVLREPQYGNDISVANSIWTSIHVPVSQDMITNLVSVPVDDTLEDNMYYRDDIKRNSRIFEDVYAFHNHIKGDLYKNNLKKGDTLLELAAGVGGDMFKAIKQGPSKIVGLDCCLPNIISPTRGAAVRYIREQRENPHTRLPPVLFVVGDITKNPLFEQDDKYMPILTGAQQGSTDYLKHFNGLSTFDTSSCQFAMHYACESEETFRAFAQNVKDSCRGTFFGTCSDGREIYSLLLGKKQHIFGSQGRTNEFREAGRYSKDYMETGSWEADQAFGMKVNVLLESFEKPQTEFLVPFEKVIEIMNEHGFDLVESKSFRELYGEQRRITLTDDQKSFSFLNRAFVFRRREEVEEEEEESDEVEEKEEPEEEEADEVEEEEEEEEADEVEEEEGGKRKPKKTPAKTKKLKKEEEPILFFGADESKGEYRHFSNMSEHRITIDDVEYKTVEHYFQAMKAHEFEDTEMYQKILKVKTPKATKAIGQKIANFKPEVWDKKKDGTMEKGVRTKFIQHPTLRKQLLETGDKLIGEANPRDTYWGIGTSMNLEKAKIPSKWRGKNMMGKLLMKLRDEFRAEETK
jgi:ribA/ribD-fused uncharacterized protein